MNQHIDRAVLGIDLGTQSTKATVISVGGQQLAEASVPVSAYRPRPGWMQHDAALLEITALAAGACAIQLVPNPTEIVAVGVAGQMGGAIGVDEHLDAVTPYESWMDTRADQTRDQVLQVAGDRIIRAGGIVPLAGARVRRWFAEQPEL
ncbi:MAG: FGGY family carbohydrate kinase, partial [Stackebrandtia sp.]